MLLHPILLYKEYSFLPPSISVLLSPICRIQEFWQSFPTGRSIARVLFFVINVYLVHLKPIHTNFANRQPLSRFLDTFS